jgi:hypothetical protein
MNEVNAQAMLGMLEFLELNVAQTFQQQKRSFSWQRIKAAKKANSIMQLLAFSFSLFDC